MNFSEESIEIIDYLVSKGKKPDWFSEAFPRIHHFYKSGGDPSLKGFYEHCKSRERDIESVTNINILKRLQIIKEKTEEFLKDNPESTISSIKFQKFAAEATDEIPIK